MELSSITPDKFAQQIENITRRYNMDYIQAVLFFCEKNKINIEDITELMSHKLKQKLYFNAAELNYRGYKKTARLPV